MEINIVHIAVAAIAFISAASGFRWARVRRLREECLEQGHQWQDDPWGVGLRCGRCDAGPD